MPKIVSVHAFRRGTGKSTLTANLAALAAAEGRRVGVVDGNEAWPSLHWLLGVEAGLSGFTMNDYWSGQCPAVPTACDVSARLGTAIKGRLFLAPACDDVLAFARAPYAPYTADRFDEGCQRLIEDLALDLLLIDTPAGLNQAALVALALSDVLMTVLRLDQQDYPGTAVVVDVARRLEVPNFSLLVNLVPSSLEASRVAAQIEHVYDCPVSAVLPLSEELMAACVTPVFALAHVQDPITVALKQVAVRLSG